MTHSEICFLLVEDSADDVELFQMALKKMGVKPVTVARSGQEAIDYLLREDHVGPWPTILLDLRMPGMGGIEFLKWLRQEGPEHLRGLAVVVTSASENPKDRAAAEELGIDSYMVKPIGWNRYQEYVKGMYEYWCAKCERELAEDLQEPAKQTKGTASPL